MEEGTDEVEEANLLPTGGNLSTKAGRRKARRKTGKSSNSGKLEAGPNGPTSRNGPSRATRTGDVRTVQDGRWVVVKAQQPPTPRTSLAGKPGPGSTAIQSEGRVMGLPLTSRNRVTQIGATTPTVQMGYKEAARGTVRRAEAGRVEITRALPVPRNNRSSPNAVTNPGRVGDTPALRETWS